MPHRLTLFTRTGKPLAELNAALHCTWVMNGIGQAEFTLSTRDAQCTERNLRFGNLMLFEHGSLGSWGGYLWPPRRWQNGEVTVQARSAEGLFERRYAPRAGAWQGKPGTIFRNLIDHGNNAEDLNVVEGSIRGKGVPLVVELRAQSLADVAHEIQESSSHEWWLDAARDEDGFLFFKAHWRQRRGARRDVVLIEGRHLASGPLSEQGDLVNKVLVLGEGAAMAIRPHGGAHNQRSRDLYGLTETVAFVNTTDAATLQAQAEEILERETFPRLVFSATLFGEEAFDTIALGDDLAVQLDSAGFFGNQGVGVLIRARVMAMEYSSAENKLATVFEQVPQEKGSG